MVAADLSSADVGRAQIEFDQGWTAFPYGRSTSDIAEFIYGNETVYFAQPSLSQFVPGGSGAGAFNEYSSIILKDAPTHNTLPLTGRGAPRSNTGAVLRYAPPTN